jgi:hypothetical protein
MPAGGHRHGVQGSGETSSLGTNVAGPDPMEPVGDGPWLGNGVGAADPIQVANAQTARKASPAATIT